MDPIATTMPISPAQQPDAHDDFEANPTGPSPDGLDQTKEDKDEITLRLLEAIRKAQEEVRSELDLGREMMTLAIKELEKLTTDVMGMGEKEYSREEIAQLLGGS